MSDTDDRNPVRPIDRAKDAAADTLQRGRSAAREGIAQARDRFKDATGDLGERFGSASQAARERSAEFRETARERYEDTVVQLRDGYGQVRERVDGASDELNDFVRANPGKSVLIAAGIGFVLGLALRPRD